jgi:hypothetical protein
MGGLERYRELLHVHERQTPRSIIRVPWCCLLQVARQSLQTALRLKQQLLLLRPLLLRPTEHSCMQCHQRQDWH